MSEPFATLEEVKAHLRIDSGDADSDLTLKLATATERIGVHLKNTSPYVLDGAGAPTTVVRPVVKAATLLLVGYLYKYPSGDERKDFDARVLPAPITAILAPLRVPTLA